MENKKEEKGLVVIQLNKKTLTLTILDFEGNNINAEELLQVDYSNILGDIITFPVIFNRIANIKAEVDSLLKDAEFDLKVFGAQLFGEKKAVLVKEGTRPTEAAIDALVLTDSNFKLKKLSVINIERQASIVDGLYWSAKMKGKMLEAISAKVSPEEFEREIIEAAINGVIIKSHKTNFPKRAGH